MSYLVVIVGVILFLGFVAAGRIFVKPDRVPLGMAAILILSVCGLLSFVYFGVARPHHGLLLFVALALMLVSAALFAWSVKSVNSHRLPIAFINAEPTALLTRGAFHYIRHPFYLAYTLYWIAAAIAALHWSTILLAAALIVAYVLAARYEEGLFLASDLGGAYHHYQKRAGFLWPCLL